MNVAPELCYLNAVQARERFGDPPLAEPDERAFCERSAEFSPGVRAPVRCIASATA